MKSAGLEIRKNVFCGKDKLILPTRMSRLKYSSFLHILRHSEAKMSFVSLSSCFCFHLDRLISIWAPCRLSVISDHLQPLFSNFRSILTILTVFSITIDYSRLLSITLDYSRLLSITLDYSRLLSTTLDYSFDRSREFSCWHLRYSMVFDIFSIVLPVFQSRCASFEERHLSGNAIF